MPADSEPEDKPAEIVSGPSPSARPVQDRKRTFFHPLSGLVILGVDWLAFGIDLPPAFLFTPFVCLLAFGVTFWAVARIQLRDGDGWRSASFKAIPAYCVCGAEPLTATSLVSNWPSGVGTEVGRAIAAQSPTRTERRISPAVGPGPWDSLFSRISRSSHGPTDIASTGHSSSACLRVVSAASGTTVATTTALPPSMRKTSGQRLTYSSQPIQRSESTLAFMMPSQERIMTSAILNRVTACKAWGLFAGMMIIPPVLTR